MQKHNKKADDLRLSKSVQVLLRPSEYKNLKRLQQESTLPTIAAYLRTLILRDQKGKTQTELL